MVPNLLALLIHAGPKLKSGRLLPANRTKKAAALPSVELIALKAASCKHSENKSINMGH